MKNSLRLIKPGGAAQVETSSWVEDCDTLEVAMTGRCRPVPGSEENVL